MITPWPEWVTTIPGSSRGSARDRRPGPTRRLTARRRRPGRRGHRLASAYRDDEAIGRPSSRAACRSPAPHRDADSRGGSRRKADRAGGGGPRRRAGDGPRDPPPLDAGTGGGCDRPDRDRSRTPTSSSSGCRSTRPAAAGTQAEITRDWVAALEPLVGVTITLRDERLSSHLAEAARRPDEAGPLRRPAEPDPARRLPRPGRSRSRGDHPPG